MNINCIRIKNFRRLKDVLIDFETDISIFVGANNSGKTSASYILDMFVNREKDKFSIYDFTACCWAEINQIGDDPKKSIDEGAELPTISLDLWFNFKANDVHRIMDLLPELEWEGTIVGLRIQFQPKSTVDILNRYIEAKEKVAQHVPAQPGKKYKPWPKNLIDFLGKSFSQEYEFRYYVLDQKKVNSGFIEENGYVPSELQQDVGKSLVRSLLRVDTLHAQRYLSDQSSNVRAEDLSKCLSRFYKRNLEKREEDHEALSALFDSEAQFNDHLKKVFDDTLKRLSILGYPGILNPHLIIRSALNPTTIMSQDTRVHYSLDGSDDGLALPDNYNGLGFKNLIYMVVELLDIQAQWIDQEEDRALLQVIVIEEPEAHLHTQLQQIFIRQIIKILTISGEDAQYYSTQLAITTHSPHILYERGFRPIRYFRREGEAGVKQYSIALNLSKFYAGALQKDFLERYMKLTHCDLFFADAAILVEGNVERILLPLMIEKMSEKLNTSYLSILEVGGAYAFRFKNLIEFLGIPALVITDLDSVKVKVNAAGTEAEEEDDDEEPSDEIEIEEPVGEDGEVETKKYRIGKACRPNELNCITSNQTLVKWLPQKTLISELLQTEENAIIQKPSEQSTATIYVAFQKDAEVEWNEEKLQVAGRTLEESFALENAKWCQEEDRTHLGLRFRKQPQNIDELADKIHKRVGSKSFNKTNFALGVLAEKPETWSVPKYIRDGLTWLVKQLVIEEFVPDAEIKVQSNGAVQSGVTEEVQPAMVDNISETLKL
jgi:predicted ATP-dependent endonuclease of OLD family